MQRVNHTAIGTGLLVYFAIKLKVSTYIASNVFLIPPHICFGYSLEMPHRGASYEYPQLMRYFHLEIRNIYIYDVDPFWLRKVPYPNGAVHIEIKGL